MVREALESHRSVLRWGLLGLVALAPLPFGSVQSWAVVTLQLWAASLGLYAVLILHRDPEPLPRKARVVLIASVFLVAVGVIQLLPAPEAWTEWVASPTADARTQVARALPETASRLAPQSLEPIATLDAVLRLVAYVLIGLAAVVSFRSSRHLRQAATVIVVSGALQAFYGAGEYLSGRQQIFGYVKQYYTDAATGTFINRNHFAGYLAMTLPLALGLLLEGIRRLPAARNWRDRVIRLADPAGAMVAVGGVGAALVWAGVILSYSRGGLAAALAAGAFVLFSAAQRKRRMLLLVAVLALPTILLLWGNVEAPGERFLAGEGEIGSIGGRLPVWKATVRMVPDYLPLGSGLGTFAELFALYRPPEVKLVWDHAHNDWLQALSEGGPLVVGALLVMLVVAVRGSQRTRHGCVPGLTLVACAAAGIVAVTLHSLVDFGLRIPANAALLACLVGMACSERPAPGREAVAWPGKWRKD